MKKKINLEVKIRVIGSDQSKLLNYSGTFSNYSPLDTQNGRRS